MKILFWLLIAPSVVNAEIKECADFFYKKPEPADSFLFDKTWYDHQLGQNGWAHALSAADPRAYLTLVQVMTKEGLRIIDDFMVEETKKKDWFVREELAIYQMRLLYRKRLSEFVKYYHQRLSLSFYLAFVRGLSGFFNTEMLMAYSGGVALLDFLKIEEFNNVDKLKRITILPVFYPLDLLEHTRYLPDIYIYPVTLGRDANFDINFPVVERAKNQFHQMPDHARVQSRRILNFLLDYSWKSENDRALAGAFVVRGLYGDFGWRKINRTFTDLDFLSSIVFQNHLTYTISRQQTPSDKFIFFNLIRNLSIDYQIALIGLGIINPVDQE